MNIKPLADRVLVLPAPAEEKVGGIIIPDTAKEKPQRGKVVATGKGTKDEEMILKEGDTVVIPLEHYHAIKAITQLTFIEVQNGNPLVEEDIERFDYQWKMK